MSTFERVLAVLGGVAGIGAFIFAVVQVYKIYQWKRRISWDDAFRVAEDLLKQFESETWKPAIVLGLGRSGGIWGGWIAGNLESLPLAVVDVKYEKTSTGRNVEFPGAAGVLASVRETYGDGVRVLLIEGAASTGQTFQEFRARFQEALQGWDLRTAVLYRHSTAVGSIDFVGKGDLIPWPVDEKPFPWHHRAAYRPFLGYVTGKGAACGSFELSS